MPLARAGVTITGPSTGRLSMPVSLTSFHGLSRGWPTLTESSLIVPLDLIGELVGAFGIVGADHPGQPHHGPFRIKPFCQTGREEGGQRGPEARRPEVVQLGQPERVRGVQELAVGC